MAGWNVTFHICGDSVLYVAGYKALEAAPEVPKGRTKDLYFKPARYQGAFGARPPTPTEEHSLPELPRRSGQPRPTPLPPLRTHSFGSCANIYPGSRWQKRSRLNPSFLQRAHEGDAGEPGLSPMYSHPLLHLDWREGREGTRDGGGGVGEKLSCLPKENMEINYSLLA